VLVAGALACSSAARAPLSKAGEDKDEGGGDLARSSMHLMLGDDEAANAGGAHAARANPYGGDVYGGDAYGGTMYGGDPYGGATYAGWAIPQWSYQAPNRIPKYNMTNGLTGVIEGIVTWAGAPPPKVMTACGPIDNPTLRVGSDHGVRGALVYIEKVSVGRVPVNYGKPAMIGGVMVKRGCALVPARRRPAHARPGRRQGVRPRRGGVGPARGQGRRDQDRERRRQARRGLGDRDRHTLLRRHRRHR
jgi:hypothetical protein